MNALCEIGLSSEFQELIATQKRLFVLWDGSETISPGGDMVGIVWHWANYIHLTGDGIRLETHHEYGTKAQEALSIERDDSDYLSAIIPYGVDDTFLRTRLLWKIATPYPLDIKEVLRHNDRSVIQTTDMLFEILAECADPKKLERYFRLL